MSPTFVVTSPTFLLSVPTTPSGAVLTAPHTPLRESLLLRQLRRGGMSAVSDRMVNACVDVGVTGWSRPPFL